MHSDPRTPSANSASGVTGILRRLRRDRRGNVLGIVAASILPIAGFIGSGLDLSRAYLVRTRLQQACDAGVLAGRKVMGAGGSLTTTVTGEVNKFVNFNFPQRSMDTAAFAIAPTVDVTTDTIAMSLSTTMNTAIMKLFAIPTLNIAVTCSAHDDYANLDIMLVLDTTGSMACKPERSDSDCSNWVNSNNRAGKTMNVGGRTVTYVEEETNGIANISRMQGLRDAVASLQNQIGQIDASFSTAPSASRKRVRWSIVPFSMGVNAGLSTDSSNTTLYSRRADWFNTTGSYMRIFQCGRSLCADGPRSPAHDSSWMSNTWDGCVEERRTSNAITPNSGHQIPSNLPSTAYDLMFDTSPTNTDTRWTVSDPSQVGVSQYACPKAMREWQSMNASDFSSYFSFNQGFVANGGTYLDVGMLWAARLLSRTGMWSSDNPAIHNGFPVRRFVILMTDGVMDTGNTGYSTYAQEVLQKRVTTDGAIATSNANHTRRLLMTCNAIRNMQTEIYVISFGAGSTLTSDLQACSSGSGFGFKADNSAQLAQVFRNIGDNIGSLRLSR